MVHEDDCDSNCSWSPWRGPKELGKGLIDRLIDCNISTYLRFLFVNIHIFCVINSSEIFVLFCFVRVVESVLHRVLCNTNNF